MRLLVVTQAVDQDDPVLGFFHAWVAELAKRYGSLVVICLKEGRHSLPQNVRVYSLGKEKGRASRGVYAFRFLSLIWRLRKEYDAAFVHMNQEYVLIGGLSWRLLGKKIYLWRNHYKGSVLTNIAVALSDKAFCTSKHSYTARFERTVVMPVGVDTDLFRLTSATRNPRSILSIGRISPSKNIHVLLDALHLLNERNVTFTADIYGDALPHDEPYLNELKRKVQTYGLSGRVQFGGAITHEFLPSTYGVHEIFVNMSLSGMLDKTIFEAAAAGCTVLASSKDFAARAGSEYVFPEGNAAALARKLEEYLGRATGDLSPLAREHSLQALGQRLVTEMA